MFRGRIARLASAGPWVAAWVLVVACGHTKSDSKDASPTGSGGSAGEGGGGRSTGGVNSAGTANSSGAGGTGGSATGGSATGGSAMGGSSGSAGAGGSAGEAGSGATTSSGATAGSAGAARTGGAAGAGGRGNVAGSAGDGGIAGSVGDGGSAGSSLCVGISECAVAGTSCDQNTLVTCAPGADGCLLEERTDCYPQPCDDTGTAVCASHGDSCDTPLVVSEPLVLRGDSFPDDYTATFTLAGSGCAGFGNGNEMVLQVDLEAGQAVAVRQFGDSQTALSIATDCAPDAACLVSTDALYGHEETGIHYRATDATTVFVIVDLIGGGIIWDYNVFVDFPESLGAVAGGDPIPDVVVTGNDPNRELRVIEFTEQVQLRGSIDVGGAAAYLSFSLVAPDGSLVESITATGDDSFGPFNVPAGDYRVIVSGAYPDTMTVSMTVN